jgi:hypothetical protein
MIAYPTLFGFRVCLRSSGISAGFLIRNHNLKQCLFSRLEISGKKLSKAVDQDLYVRAKNKHA